jgi:hypothetical protein
MLRARFEPIILLIERAKTARARGRCDPINSSVTHKCKATLIRAELRSMSPRANYIDRDTAACRRSYCQLWRIEGVTQLA